MLLGMQDFTIFLAYFLNIALVVLCLVYGIMNWNKGGDPSEEELEKEKAWMKEESELDEEVSEGGIS